MASKFADPNEPVQYPGVMKTYPGMVRGQPPIYVHDCVPGCPGMPKRPLVPIAGGSGAAKAVGALMSKPGGGMGMLKPKVPKKVVSHCTHPIAGVFSKLQFIPGPLIDFACARPVTAHKFGECSHSHFSLFKKMSALTF